MRATAACGVIIALIVLAAATRVAVALLLGGRFHFIDETIYVDAARHLLAGEGFGSGYANVPAHPVFLAALAMLAPASLTWLRAAQALVTGLAGATIVHALGTRTVGPRATRVALVLYALDPLMVVAGALFYPEAIAAVVLGTALLAAVTAVEQDRPTAGAVAGALLGLTVLFRPVAVVLLPLVALWVALRTTTSGARRVRHGLVVVAGCVLTISPWVVANLARDGHVIPVGMAGLQNAPVSTHAIHESGLATALGREAELHPSALLHRMARQLGGFWELYPTRLATDDPTMREAMHRQDERLPTDASFPPSLRNAVSASSSAVELVLALGGCVLGWRSRRPVVVLFAAVALVYGLGYALFVAKLRYRIVVLPGVFLLAGLGVALATEAARTGRRDTATAPLSIRG